MRLGNLVTVQCLRKGELLHPGDIVIRRIGGEEDVGRVLEFAIEEQAPASRFDSVFVVRVTDWTRLLPEYLFYTLHYLHSVGYYRTRATGTLRRKCLRVRDVTDIPSM